MERSYYDLIKAEADRKAAPAGPRVVAIPSDRAWFDPRLMIAATETTISDVPVTAGQIATLAVPDPTRIAIGFGINESVVGDVQLGPWPDVDVTNLITSGTLAGAAWFDLQNYFGLVGLAWYGLPTANGFIRVITVRRN